MQGEVHGRDFHYQPIGQQGEEQGQGEADDVGYQQAEEPDFVTVVGDAEDNLDDFGVLVILDAEAGGVEDEQDGGHQQHAVAGRHGDFIVGEKADAHRQDIEPDGAQDEIEELVAEDDFDVVFGQLYEGSADS